MAITRLQERKSSAGPSSTADITTLSNVTAGSLVIVTVSRYTSGSALTVSSISKLSGTATLGSFQLDQQNGPFGGGEDAIFSVPVTGSGSLTIRVTGASGNYWTLGIAEYSGVDTTSSRAESTNENTYNGSGTASTGDASSAAGALFVGCLNSNAGGDYDTTPSGAGWAQVVEEIEGASYMVLSMTELIVTGATTDAAEWTLPSANSGCIGVVVYKEAAGGPATVTGSASLPVVAATTTAGIQWALGASSLPAVAALSSAALQEAVSALADLPTISTLSATGTREIAGEVALLVAAALQSDGLAWVLGDGALAVAAALAAAGEVPTGETIYPHVGVAPWSSVWRAGRY